MSLEKGKPSHLGNSLIDSVFNVVSGKKAFRVYEVIVTLLGASSVPVSLAFLTAFFLQGSLPQIMLPKITNLLGFLAIIAGLIVALLTHELSHLVILANHGIRAKSLGISLTGVFGGYVQADVPKEEYEKIRLPFFSSGLGANVITFIFSMAAYILGITGIAPFAAVTIWFTVLNSIPAPLMDGGKIFEALLERLRLDNFADHIAALVLITWILAFVVRVITM